MREEDVNLRLNIWYLDLCCQNINDVEIKVENGRLMLIAIVQNVNINLRDWIEIFGTKKKSFFYCNSNLYFKKHSIYLWGKVLRIIENRYCFQSLRSTASLRDETRDEFKDFKGLSFDCFATTMAKLNYHFYFWIIQNWIHKTSTLCYRTNILEPTHLFSP